MGFKDIIQGDIQAVFLNPDEFAAKHLVNGKLMTVTIDDNEMIEREKKALNKGEDGLYKRTLLIYVAAAEFGPLPAVGKLLEIDRGRYRIMDAVNEDGIYSISLEAVRAT